MTRLAALLAAALVFAAVTSARSADPPASGKYWVFLGTYTGGKGGSKGIYRCELDAKTGKLSEPEVAAEVGSPSFLTLTPNGRFLYAVGETAGKKGEGGGVYAYGVDAATGKLTLINQQTSGGDGPCHVSTDPTGRLVLVANYGGGSWALFHTGEDGRLSERVAFLKLQGMGPNADRQEAPHAHCGAFHPTDRAFFVVDLGSDRVWVYKYEITGATGRGAVKVQSRPPIRMPAGSGPRHIAIAPAGDVAFVNGELDSTVSVVRMSAQADHFDVAQTESTLPGGKPVKGNSTAEVRIHPNGKFVYVSNRGHNSVAAFGWDGKKLTPIGHATEGINVPRNFNLDPTGRWMLVANEQGSDVLVFEVGADGLPKPTGNKVNVGKPVCVKFLAKP